MYGHVKWVFLNRGILPNGELACRRVYHLFSLYPVSPLQSHAYKIKYEDRCPTKTKKQPDAVACSEQCTVSGKTFTEDAVG